MANRAPTITSNGGRATASLRVVENNTSVTTVVAKDLDRGAVLTYSIYGGDDADKFQIDPKTGALRFITGPDFESPTDSGFNNVYDVIVSVSDGIASAQQAIAVTIADVYEPAQAKTPPTITSGGGAASHSLSVAENTTTVMSVTATSPNKSAVLAYSIAGGVDGALFTINASTGALSFRAPPDRETPADAGANNVYDVNVQVSDGRLVDTQAIAVTVTNVNEVPTTTTVVLATIAEDSGARLISQADLLVNAADVDGSAGLAATGLTLDTGTGTLTDNLDGTWSFTPSLNDETSVSFTYSVQDSADLAAAGQATLEITPVNDNPTISAATPGALTENSTTITSVSSLILGDVDFGDSVSYDTTDWTAVNATQFTQEGLYGIAMLDIAAHTLTYTLDAVRVDPLNSSDHPTEEFIVAVRDNAGGTDSASVSFTVNGVSDTSDTLRVAVAYGAFQQVANDVASQLADSTRYDFETVVLDTSSLDSAVELSEFDLVIHTQHYMETPSLAYLTALSDYVNSADGGVITTGWVNYTIDERMLTQMDSITPITDDANSRAYARGPTLINDGGHPILDVLPEILWMRGVWDAGSTLDSGAAGYLRWSSSMGNNDLNDYATSPYLVTKETDSGGRMVYLAGTYADAAWRYLDESGSPVAEGLFSTGHADLLFEAAAAWAGGVLPVG